MFVNDVLRYELTWTETSYTVKTTPKIDLSGLSKTVTHRVGVRMKVSGGVGYVRVVDFYWTR